MEKAPEQAIRKFENSIKKRFACVHCGKTWVEIVGTFALNTGKQEETFIQTIRESEACQNCKFNIRTCPTCNSKDTYEINFALDNAQDAPLSFDRIRTVSKT